jgi:predicted ester cyclase
MSDITDVARRYFAEQVSEGRSDGVGELFADDVVMHSPLGRLEGLGDVARLTDVFKTAMPDGRIWVEDVVVEGDRIAWRVHGKGTHGGPFLDVQATGRPIEWVNTDSGRLRDGKVVELWGGPDLFTILTQIGVIPQPQAAPA